ncbi:MAG: hypothetical protein U5P41_05690 [Gammaproteobacteria bacterium]|nr:hypothetical protein [Gammaproteobacteria bacterium]
MRFIEFGGNTADMVKGLAVRVVFAVRHVEAEDVGTGGQQPADAVGIVGRRANGGDNLGTPLLQQVQLCHDCHAAFSPARNQK